MARIAFYSILLGVAAYSYTNGNYVWAFLCLLLWGYLVVQNRLTRVWSVLSALERAPSELDCNTFINCRFSIEHLIAHPSVQNLYRSLHVEGKVGAESFDKWTQLLLENYTRTFTREKPFEEVTFNIKNNLVFKNEKPDFWMDSVYHEFAIPFRCPEAGEEENSSFMTESDEVQLSIRLFIINGILKLQVGNFSKRHSPELLHEGALASYVTWATVTEFPLIYFSYRHGLPVRYLNLSSHATESYKVQLSAHRQKWEKKPFWKRAPNMFDDWRVLQRDVAAYRILCDQDSTHYSHSVVNKLEKSFGEKRKTMLEKEGFKTHERGDDHESWRYPDTGEQYWNDHIWLQFQNLNLRRDYAERHWWTDYYEEQP
jgi:hypothetical protein